LYYHVANIIKDSNAKTNKCISPRIEGMKRLLAAWDRQTVEYTPVRWFILRLRYMDTVSVKAFLVSQLGCWMYTDNLRLIGLRICYLL